MDQFSSKPSVSLEKSIDTSTALVETNPADIDRVYELEKCFEWITENNYKKVSRIDPFWHSLYFYISPI